MDEQESFGAAGMAWLAEQRRRTRLRRRPSFFTRPAVKHGFALTTTAGLFAMLALDKEAFGVLAFFALLGSAALWLYSAIRQSEAQSDGASDQVVVGWRLSGAVRLSLELGATPTADRIHLVPNGFDIPVVHGQVRIALQGHRLRTLIETQSDALGIYLTAQRVRIDNLDAAPATLLEAVDELCAWVGRLRTPQESLVEMARTGDRVDRARALAVLSMRFGLDDALVADVRSTPYGAAVSAWVVDGVLRDLPVEQLADMARGVLPVFPDRADALVERLTELEAAPHQQRVVLEILELAAAAGPSRTPAIESLRARIVETAQGGLSVSAASADGGLTTVD